MVAELELESQKSEALLKQERDLRALNQAFRESEEKRRKVTERVHLKKTGTPLPGSSMAIFKEVQDVKQTLSDVLEGRAFQRVSKVLETIQSRAEVVEELKQFGLEIDALSDVLKGIEFTVTSVNHKLQVLSDQFSADFEDRRRLRQQQRETLGKLNQYLKDWV